MLSLTRIQDIRCAARESQANAVVQDANYMCDVE